MGSRERRGKPRRPCADHDDVPVAEPLEVEARLKCFDVEVDHNQIVVRGGSGRGPSYTWFSRRGEVAERLKAAVC